MITPRVNIALMILSYLFDKDSLGFRIDRVRPFTQAVMKVSKWLLLWQPASSSRHSFPKQHFFLQRIFWSYENILWVSFMGSLWSELVTWSGQLLLLSFLHHKDCVSWIKPMVFYSSAQFVMFREKERRVFFEYFFFWAVHQFGRGKHKLCCSFFGTLNRLSSKQGVERWEISSYWFPELVGLSLAFTEVFQ